MNTSPKPVRLISRKDVLSNRVWSVSLDHIRDEHGVEVEDYITVGAALSPRADLITGVTILPLLGDRIVLQRQYRHPVEKFLWELPRGFVEPGESPEHAVLRELEEETGLLCDEDDLVPLGVIYHEPSTLRSCGAAFVARNCRPGGKALADEPGLMSAESFPYDEVAAMLGRFEIEEAGSTITLFRYGLWRKGHPG